MRNRIAHLEQKAVAADRAEDKRSVSVADLVRGAVGARAEGDDDGLELPVRLRAVVRVRRSGLHLGRPVVVLRRCNADRPVEQRREADCGARFPTRFGRSVGAGDANAAL